MHVCCCAVLRCAVQAARPVPFLLAMMFEENSGQQNMAHVKQPVETYSKDRGQMLCLHVCAVCYAQCCQQKIYRKTDAHVNQPASQQVTDVSSDGPSVRICANLDKDDLDWTRMMTSRTLTNTLVRTFVIVANIHSHTIAKLL